MPQVTKIPAKFMPNSRNLQSSNAKRRVAGYARVSTDSDEQFTSYEAQIDYYTNYIKSNPAWEFIDVYTDEGISGTNTKHREGFKRMVNDALNGKIDLIVTKSVSRFARNTVDSLTTIRQLKEAGCECFFEKENIYTFDGKGELLLTIMSSLAQEESRSISENVTWGLRKRFADGKVILPYKHFLGYEKGEDDLPKIVESEAKIIRYIYALFIEGKTLSTIAARLTKEGIPTPTGKTNWSKSTIESILSNEKYKGAAVLQKTFTVDFLTKKKKINEGEVDKYYIENSHPAIIPPDEWGLVQLELERRKAMGSEYRCDNILSCKIVCEDCGRYYGSKVWHSTNSYKRTIWRCNGKYDNSSPLCQTPTFTEEIIKERFVQAYNALNKNRQVLLDTSNIVIDTISNTGELDRKLEETEYRLQYIKEQLETLINSNATTVQSQEDYFNKYNRLESEYNALHAEYGQLYKERKQIDYRIISIKRYFKDLTSAQEQLDAFDEKMWLHLIDKVIAKRNGSLEYIFRDGSSVII